MGRGNVCVKGEYEGLYYVPWSYFAQKVHGENGEIIEDYKLANEDFKVSLDQFKRDFTSKYPSFYDCDKYLSNDSKAVLENGLFYIAIEDNEWSIAIKLIQKEQEYNQKGNIENFQARLYKTYLEGMKECLFNQFDELYVYGGPWTSGKIQKAS